VVPIVNGSLTALALNWCHHVALVCSGTTITIVASGDV
jgi:hypothetical protein